MWSGRRRAYYYDMDTTLSTAEVAAALGTSVPRVHRAVEKGLVHRLPGRGTARGLRFSASAVGELRRVWGEAPKVPGLTRENVLILAALARRPRGVRSARVLAREAGVSPTTASATLRRLRDQGYVAASTLRAVEGRAIDAPVWSVRWTAPQWRRIAPVVGGAVLPSRTDVATAPPARVPRRLWHLFWDVDPAVIETRAHGAYIADRVLRSSDNDGLAWAAQVVPAATWRAVARRRGLTDSQRRLARALGRRDAP